jgi:hypothetical protein
LPHRYTFAVKNMFWLAILVAVVAAVWIVARVRRTIRERERESEARAANLLAGLAGAAPRPANAVAPQPPAAAPLPARAATLDDISLQKLLFEAARKAGEAGEPALAIQLYGRLLARFPATGLADPARAAVEAQKKALHKER